MEIQTDLKHKKDTLAEALGCEQKDLDELTAYLDGVLKNKKLKKTSSLIEEARNNLSYNELLVSFGVLCKEVIKFREKL